MKNFLQDIDNILIDSNAKINDKIFGINYLEKIKYHLMDKLKDIQLNNIGDIDNQELIKEFGEKKLLFKLEKHKESKSIIKNTIPLDQLSIVLVGFKSIEIHEKETAKKSSSLNLYKNMGIVVPKETILSESISKETILLNIIIIN